MLKKLITKWNTMRRVRRFNAAIKVIESEGRTCCRIEYRGNTPYILSEDGAWYKIGKRN